MSYFLKNRMFPRSRGLLFSLKASVKALTACWYHSSCLVFREVTARNDSILEKVVVLAFFFFFHKWDKWIDWNTGPLLWRVLPSCCEEEIFFFQSSTREIGWPAQMDECGERQTSTAFTRKKTTKNSEAWWEKKQEWWIFMSHWSAEMINNWNFIQSPITARLLRNHIAQCRVFHLAAGTVWMSREWLIDSFFSPSGFTFFKMFLLHHGVWWCHSETTSDWKHLCGYFRALKVWCVGFRGIYWQI